MKGINNNLEKINIFKAALEKGQTQSFSQLAYSHALYVKIRAFLPTYTGMLEKRQSIFKSINSNNKEYLLAYEKAKMYIQHFIIVLNLSIMRNELSINVRKYYGLKISENSAPNIETAEDLIQIGKKVIEGEHKRTAIGGTPLFNPRMSMVEVFYNEFLDLYETKQILNESYNKCNEKVLFLQSKADYYLKKLFEEIISKTNHLKENQQSNILSEYGFHENNKGNTDKNIIGLSA